MLLTVDLGNTNIVFGLYEQTELKHTFRVATVRGRTEDEYGALLFQLLALRSLSPSSVSAAILASVVPQLTDVMTQALRRTFARDPLVVGGPGLKTGISVHYDNPRDVGADRIVNAVAAFERFHQGAVIVDFGTATTFDCVSPKGEYLGGVIVPGVQVSLDALLQRAAKIGPVELVAPPQVVGKNTPHAVQSGLVHGYAALVDGLLERIQDELGFDCKVLATGGLAGLIAPHTRRVRDVDPHLTLEGLRILYELNAGGSARGRSRAKDAARE
jgi:type III pantothenate kinase